ncbi:aspartate kinase [Flavobacteriaceae bacterium]|jgi:aspartate kinase|nr:aspartate kinase [Flavobacteriaceae bacterium]
MRVFKFGGASIKDAEGVKNLVKVLNETGYDNILIVVSAMGKTTNSLERVIKNYFDNHAELKSSIKEIQTSHDEIISQLFKVASHPIISKINNLFIELTNFFGRNKSPDYNFVYDQVVGFGELISTSIISAYLNEIGIKNHWLDIREYVKTDSYYRNAKVNWKATQSLISKQIKINTLNITQGFIASDSNNFTTTLGREGSDYTAAILAYCLNANSVTIWKDVPGVLNADPRYFKNPQLLKQISYREAIELAFYGASVIHPKTLQPLQQKEIPFFVKSFLNPKNDGTCIGKGKKIDPVIPCFIVKKNQVLIELSSLDFSFMLEENISEIFQLLHLYKMKVDVIQNSAISFSVCIDNNYNNLNKLILHLKAKFKVIYNTNVDLYTIRHYNKSALAQLEEHKTVLLKQIHNETVQIVTK